MWWEGLHRAPLAVLLGGGARPVRGRGAPRRPQSPPARRPPRSAAASPARVPRAARWPPLGEPAPADGARDQQPQHPAPLPHGGRPRLHELSPTWPAPQKDMQIGTPVSCRRCQLTSVSAPSCGRSQVRRWVRSQAPWASGIIFWSGGWGGGVLQRAWGLWEGRRAGEVPAWAPGLAKSANGDVCL